MKKRLPTVALAAVLLIGLGLLLYPTFSDQWNKLHQSRAIAGYQRMVDNTSEEEMEARLHAAEAYNVAVAQRGGVRPLLTEEEQEEYRAVLDAGGTGIMGYIEIPAIGCALPVYHGTDESVLQIAVGHLEGSSLPVGGASTHCVLSGHRGLPSARIFTDLDRLEPGDRFMVYTLNRTLTYEIDQIQIVLPTETEALAIEAGADLCTLMTCTPYGVNTHRLLVRGRRVANQAAGATHVSANALIYSGTLIAPLFAVPLLLIALIVWSVAVHRKTKRNAVFKKLKRHTE